MSIATEITRIQTAKSNIKTQIEAKGVTVPSSATIDTYPTYVSQITTGDDSALISLIERGFSSFEIPSGTTQIGSYAFFRCYGLRSITIPETVTIIQNNAFQYCSGMTSVDIPDSVTYVNTNSFGYCTDLSDVTIGSGIVSLNTYCFQSCTNLSSVTIKATNPPSLQSSTFQNTNDTFIIYVPSESVEAYKTASEWSTYASRIQAITS